MRSPRLKLADAAVAITVLFPVLPWLAVGPVGERFDRRETLHSVANLAAFFAISAWAVNLVLASRVRPLERFAGGLEHLYRLHRRVGITVVALALIHVAFLALYAGADAGDLFLPAAGWATFSGVVAVLLLVVFVGVTVAVRTEYQTFLRIQQLIGAAFLIGAFHTFAVRGTAADSTVLAVYVAVLTAAGAAGLAYRVAGGMLGVGRLPYRVDAVRRLDDQTVEIAMLPVARALEFRAGQFVYVTFHQDGIPRESHPFTIAGAPGAGPLTIVVKRFGDFTSRVMELRPGAGVDVEGPFGDFQLRQSERAQTWIAGGIGITPFLSWARSLEGPTPIDLYYCTPAAEHAHFLDELFTIADRHPTLRVVPIRKSSLGRLSVRDIAAVNPRLTEGHVFVCGPQVMIDNLRTGLVASGMAPERIHSECFDFR